MTSPALSKPLSMDEFRGLSAIARARPEHLITMFSGARNVYGTAAKASAAHKIGSTGKKVYSSATKLTKGTDVAKTAAGGLRAKAIELITEAVGVQDIGDLAEVIAREGVKTGKGIVEPKGIGDKLKSRSVSNARFQFKRQVSAGLPF